MNDIGLINVIANGYAETELPNPNRDDVNNVMVAGRARLYAK